jgi:hypothetical protein
MIITKINPIMMFSIETDDPYHPYYRRYETRNWEGLYGDSWEPIGNDEALEEEFKRMMGERGISDTSAI